MTNSTIELTFDNELSDHLLAAKLFYKNSIWSKTDKLVGGLLIFFGFILVWQTGYRWWSIIWFPIGIAEWFNLLSLKRLQLFLFFKKNPKFLETYNLTFSESGIHFKTKSIDSHLEWNYYNKYLEDDNVILLIYGTNMYTVIPKRVFSKISELQRFKNLLTQKIVNRNQETI